jgi:hypothetical protein
MNIFNSENVYPKHIRSILPEKWEFRDRKGLGETMNRGSAPHMAERKTETTHADMNKKRSGGARF